MAHAGDWEDHKDIADLTAPVRSTSLRLSPVFSGEVYYAYRDNGWCWLCSLNGKAMGGYPTKEAAQARIDWEIWNSLRQISEPYKRILARRASWEGGAG